MKLYLIKNISAPTPLCSWLKPSLWRRRSRGVTAEGVVWVQPDVVYFIVSQRCHVIHYTLLWSWTHECLQSLATPNDKANCRRTAIVFKAPFAAAVLTVATTKNAWMPGGRALHVEGTSFVSDYGTWFCFFCLILDFPCCHSVSGLFQLFGLVLHGRCWWHGGCDCLTGAHIKEGEKTFPNHGTHPGPFSDWFFTSVTDWPTLFHWAQKKQKKPSVK